MLPQTKIPSVGEPIRAEWGAGVTRNSNQPRIAVGDGLKIVSASQSNGVVIAAKNATQSARKIRHTDFPFQISRGDQVLDQSTCDTNWLIHLPPECVSIGGRSTSAWGGCVNGVQVDQTVVPTLDPVDDAYIPSTVSYLMLQQNWSTFTYSSDYKTIEEFISDGVISDEATIYLNLLHANEPEQGTCTYVNQLSRAVLSLEPFTIGATYVPNVYNSETVQLVIPVAKISLTNYSYTSSITVSSPPTYTFDRWRVTQYLHSPVALSSPSTSSGSSAPGLFEPDFAGTFSRCAVMLGTTYYSFGTLTSQPTGDGYYQARINLSSSSPACTIVMGANAFPNTNGLDVATNIYYMPLFQISSSEIVADYRNIHFVPVYG